MHEERSNTAKLPAQAMQKQPNNRNSIEQARTLLQAKNVWLYSSHEGAPVEGLLYMGHSKAMLSEGAVMSRSKLQKAVTACKAGSSSRQTADRFIKT